MTDHHRPEPGRTQGVAAWANSPGADGWFCTIVCTRGHRKRTIEHIRWAGRNGQGDHLYTAGYRLDDLAEPLDADPGTSAEHRPTSGDFKCRLRCPCGLDVVLSNENLDRLVEGLHDDGRTRIELAAIAASL